jgi:site-specific DNA-cytosine methylase
VKFLYYSSSDVKVAARNFCRAADIEAGHVFGRMQETEVGSGYCFRHKKNCALTHSGLDLYVAGTPCQDWSGLGGFNPDLDDIEKGQNYDCMKSFVGKVAKYRPRVWVLEQVASFAKRRTGDVTGLDNFRSLMDEKAQGCASMSRWILPFDGAVVRSSGLGHDQRAGWTSR